MKTRKKVGRQQSRDTAKMNCTPFLTQRASSQMEQQRNPRSTENQESTATNFDFDKNIQTLQALEISIHLKSTLHEAAKKNKKQAAPCDKSKRQEPHTNKRLQQLSRKQKQSQTAPAGSKSEASQTEHLEQPSITKAIIRKKCSRLQKKNLDGRQPGWQTVHLGRKHSIQNEQEAPPQQQNLRKQTEAAAKGWNPAEPEHENSRRE